MTLLLLIAGGVTSSALGQDQAGLMLIGAAVGYAVNRDPRGEEK